MTCGQESWWYPEVESAVASSDAAGHSGGMATIMHFWGYGSRWRRGMVLLRQGVLCVVDDVTLGPGQQSSGREYIAGPMFSLNSGATEGPMPVPSSEASGSSGGSSYWNVAGFGAAGHRGSVAPTPNASLLVLMAGAAHADSRICSIMAGASSCRPDLPRCNASAKTSRGAPMCPQT